LTSSLALWGEGLLKSVKIWSWRICAWSLTSIWQQLHEFYYNTFATSFWMISRAASQHILEAPV
jgi:hypothetical protein